MKQIFTENEHKKFINYFNIKKSSTEIENIFYKKTIKYIKYIKWIPGLKMIGIGNSVAMNCANKNSDIDLLIVTTPDSIWLNRILITLIFQILGVRKTNKKHSGMFCLSFFATTDGLDFSSWKIKNDIYLYFWILYFKPILDYENTYDLFINKNKSWANFDKYGYIIKKNKKYIKYYFNSQKNKKYIKNSFIYKLSIIKLINILFKKIFLPKTLKHFEKIGKPYGVIINDNLLKFHNSDIRQKIKEKLLK